MGRVKGGWREAPAWTAPLVFTSAAIMLLVVFGTLALIPWLVIALIPLAVVAAKSARAWREIAKLQGRVAATASVLGRLAARLRNALWNAREDLRALGGRLRRGDDPGEAVRPAAPPPAGSPPRWPSAVREVPPLRGNAALGEAPAAVEVGVSLQAAGVMVHPEAAAFAEMIRNFDPDDDEDELLGFTDSLATDFLFIFEAFQDLAENLLTGTGLDPAYAIGFIDISDEGAEFTAAFALLDRLYHDTYAGIHEHVDAGRTLPHNGRRYFHADGGAPEGGTAA